jgi:Protein of unknown function (DUF2786)
LHGRDGSPGPTLLNKGALRSRSGSIHRGETPPLHHLLMGTKNRERRRVKQSKRRKQQRERASWQETNPDARGLQGPADADEMADELILAAAHADCEGFDHATHLPSLIEILAQGMGLEGGRDLVAGRLGSLVQSAIARVLDSGWAPHEISRVVRRQAGATAASIMAGSLAEVTSRRHPGGHSPESATRQAKRVRKLDPASPSWKADLATTIAAFCVLEHLPVLRDLGGIRSRTRNVRSHEEERTFTRIRGLLTKAESSDYSEESDAFMAKAQELMTRYCIDRTMVEADAEEDGIQQVDARRVWLEDPYIEAKALLLANVASANRARAVVDPVFGFSTLVGHPEDLDATDLLFTSLLVQAMGRITALGKDPTFGRRSRKPSYRRSFFVGYAGRIGSRLREANEAATVAADHAFGNCLLPVLARREEQLDAAVGTLFGELEELKFSLTDVAGWAAGTAAADMAELAVREKLSYATAS